MSEEEYEVPEGFEVGPKPPDEPDEVEMESVECPDCGGLSVLVETCERCKQSGRILRPVRLGHETLSKIRSKMADGGRYGGRYGDDPKSPRTGPKYHDPLWIGTEAP